jgi:hypothetical protein
MSDAAIHMTWGVPVVGRENQGLVVFQEAIAFWGKHKEAGNVESFRVGLARAGHLGALSGYMLIEGATGKLDTITNSEEYKRLIVKAAHIVENIAITPCDADTAIPASIERLLAVRKQLGI